MTSITWTPMAHAIAPIPDGVRGVVGVLRAPEDRRSGFVEKLREYALQDHRRIDVDPLPLVIVSNEDNVHYLRTKQSRMGYLGLSRHSVVANPRSAVLPAPLEGEARTGYGAG